MVITLFFTVYLHSYRILIYEKGYSLSCTKGSDVWLIVLIIDFLPRSGSLRVLFIHFPTKQEKPSIHIIKWIDGFLSWTLKTFKTCSFPFSSVIVITWFQEFSWAGFMAKQTLAIMLHSKLVFCLIENPIKRRIKPIQGISRCNSAIFLLNTNTHVNIPLHTSKKPLLN